MQHVKNQAYLNVWRVHLATTKTIRTSMKAIMLVGITINE
jgi:hypothetical protein